MVVEAGPEGAEPRLRMFNPDGSEFERSGNGLRIAGVYLRRLGRAGGEPFSVLVGGDRVWLQVKGPDVRGVWNASADMGRVGFPDRPPFVAAGWVGEGGRVVLELPPPPDGGASRVEVVPVSVGNPHAVAFRDAMVPGRGRPLRTVDRKTRSLPAGHECPICRDPGRIGYGHTK